MKSQDIPAPGHALDGEIEVAMIKKEQLQRLGRTMLEAIAALSALEVGLNRACPTGAERYQYIVDAVTHEMGQALADLTRRWQTSDQPAASEVKGTKRL